MLECGDLEDWLVEPVREPVTVKETEGGKRITMTNGLIQRTFATSPNFATVDYRNLVTGASLLRGVKPEAVLELDQRTVPVGGLVGQPDYAYLDPSWLEQMVTDPLAFRFAGYETAQVRTPYTWKPARHSPQMAWPPPGLGLVVDFRRPPEPAAESGVDVSIRYEMYEGIPVLSKMLQVTNTGERGVRIDSLEAEILAINEQERHRLHVESDYAFHGMKTTSWEPDPDYETQIDVEGKMPVLLKSRYPTGPGVTLEPGQSFESFRTIELVHDSDDRERKGLGRRRMYRTLAPQVTENPIFMHVTECDSEGIRSAIDQAADVGFEMVIISFWSGFDVENDDPAHLARLKELTDHAHRKGIQLGCYSLMAASKDVGPELNCISPDTGEPGSKWGQSACLASEWADIYSKRILNLLDNTGFDVIETDGPYHGDVCASTTHRYHDGLADSELRQWEACVRFYHACRDRGIFIDSPDWYYLTGSNKCGMGYRELNFALPLWRQITLSRQNIYDATFDKAPSMGWMFVPLVEYRGGGGSLSTVEPLSQNIVEYEWYLAQNFGSGVQACYRGSRLYDGEVTRSLVKKWVGFYKDHRDILDSDIIHVRRPDGQDIDCMMHVNSQTRERALAMVYNPTDNATSTTIRLPLYYTGLEKKATIRERGHDPRTYTLDRHCNVLVPVKLDAKGITYLVVEE
jgi:hypothetical protein